MQIVKYKNKYWQEVIKILQENILPEDFDREVAGIADSVKKNRAWIGLNFDGKVIGFIAVQEFDNKTKIDRLDVRQDEHRKGHGSKLINHIKRICISPIYLVTAIHNEQTQSFYQKNGFIEIEPYIAPENLKTYRQMVWNNPKK